MINKIKEFRGQDYTDFEIWEDMKKDLINSLGDKNDILPYPKG